jgi:hypothetical protein
MPRLCSGTGPKMRSAGRSISLSRLNIASGIELASGRR